MTRPTPRGKIARTLAALALAGSLASGAGATASAQSATAMLRYENGTRLFAAQRYTEAAHEFEAAYALSGQAELLFNLGRAWEDAGAISQALHAYERFETAGAPGYDLAQLRVRIARLRAALAAATATPTTPSPITAPPPPSRPPPPGAPVGPIVLMSLGGAALVAVVPLWIAARSTYSDLTTVCPMRTCPTAFQADADRAATFALTGDVLLGVGAASLAAGVTWLVLGHRDAAAERAPRVTLDCRGGGCVAGVAGRF